MAVPPGAVASGFGAATGFPATAARHRAWPRSPIHWTSTRRAGSGGAQWGCFSADYGCSGPPTS